MQHRARCTREGAGRAWAPVLGPRACRSTRDEMSRACTSSSSVFLSSLEPGVRFRAQGSGFDICGLGFNADSVGIALSILAPPRQSNNRMPERLRENRWRANVARIRQSRPDAGLCSDKILIFLIDPSALGSGYGEKHAAETSSLRVPSQSAGCEGPNLTKVFQKGFLSTKPTTNLITSGIVKILCSKLPWQEALDEKDSLRTHPSRRRVVIVRSLCSKYPWRQTLDGQD